MKMREAIEKSIRNFYDGKLPEKAIEASEKEFKYTPEYFETLKTAKPEEKKKKGAKDDAE